MKKIMNSPEHIIQDMLSGMAQSNPNTELIAKYKIVRRRYMNPDKVSLISGGGSGHEPAHAGFVGTGMLDAAVCGDVFASSSQIQVYQGIKAAASKKGVLLIIKNYSGDMMNFKNGAYLASEDGILVDYVKVDDDIAVNDSLYTVGRRGVAGTIFVHKIAGAAAEQGKSLAEVKAIAEKVIANVKSIGFALTSCTVPAKGSPTFSLGDQEIEYGVGIHGEPGIARKPLDTSAHLAQSAVSALADALELKKKDRVAVIVNGLGATPLMELYAFYHDVARELSARNLTVARVFVGNYMTSLDMAGASLSVLKLDDELETLLNEPAETAALTIHGATDSVPFTTYFPDKSQPFDVHYDMETPEQYAKIIGEVRLNNLIYLVDAMSACIIEHEAPFCELDSHAGDGDFGMSVAKGFRQLKREWKEIISQTQMMSDFLNACAMVIMEHCGGASGPIWGSAFRAASKSIAGKDALTVSDFADMMQAAVKGIQAVGARSFGRGAVVGDKTLIDALVPCADTWVRCAEARVPFPNAFAISAQAAADGAESTKNIIAHMGCAGTVGKRSLGYPDAGAYALGFVFTAIAQKMHG